MHHRIWAAIASIFVVGLASNSVVADNAVQTAVVLSYNNDSGLLDGASNGQTETLLHDAATTHQFANPDVFFPPDPCRGIAIAWNVHVLRNAPRKVFDGLLTAAAAKNCSIVFSTAGGPVPPGVARKLLSIAPGK
jgi:hypothetical protein